MRARVGVRFRVGVQVRGRVDVARSHVAEGRVLERIGLAGECRRELVAEAV